MLCDLGMQQYTNSLRPWCFAVGMQQCAMHNAKIQKTTFFQLGVCINRVIVVFLVEIVVTVIIIIFVIIILIIIIGI